MRLITLAQARAQTHSDGVDESMFEVYVNGAVRAAEQFLNRRVFEDESERSSAVADVPTQLEAADAAYEAAIEAANAMEGSARCAARAAARGDRTAALTAAEETYTGIVVNDDIRDAVLLILASLYRDRETGNVPQGAITLLWPYRRGLGV